LTYQSYQSPYDEVEIKDTDYLVISARIKAMETRMLTRDKLEQMLEAREEEDALKILTEAGYPPFSPDHPEQMDEALGSVRDDVFKDLGDSAPDGRYLDIFKTKYDYHNLKALLKANAVGADVDSMLIEMGRVETPVLKEALQTGDMSFLPSALADAAVQGRDVLDTTGDPQLSDVLLDRLMFKEQLDTAKATGSEFLTGYVRILIDAANLRASVRTLRMNKNAEFLEGVLAEGGDVAPENLLASVRSSGTGLAELFAPTLLAKAAEAGQAAIGGGAMTDFEKLCDDAVCEYLADALYVAFGEAPLVGYLAAVETEITNIRIILMGRNAKIDPDIIRSRLRATYV